MKFAEFDKRPVVVALAGPNGAGKTTFYDSHLRHTALCFINADAIARDLGLDPYVAADLANSLRRDFVKRGESFVFETVFSDPVRDKLTFLKQAAKAGYTVILCFIGIAGPEMSEQRVAMRISQGGHDVPSEKIKARFPRTMSNLAAAIRELPHVLVFDNGDLSTPFRQVAVFEHGKLAFSNAPFPEWFEPLLR
ncbi:MAG: zeta toxin family protein [Planctomycetota bacterium]